MFDLTLSFDNGPEPDVTPGVLDALAARDIKATFFLLGRKLVLPGHRAAPERAHAEGHWIGNHTWTHGAPLGTRPGADIAEAEVTRTQELLGDLAHPDKLFRPHGGGAVGPQLMSPDVASLLQAQRYTCVLWTSVPGDYRDPDGWVEPALADCASRPWTVMVLHDLPNGAMTHLPRFLDAATKAGARFRQDFPTDCTPIVRGDVIGSLDRLITTR